MALHVKSRLPGNPIKIFKMEDHKAEVIAQRLVRNGCSFYSEPYPDEMTTIWVDPEYEHAVSTWLKELAD